MQVLLFKIIRRIVLGSLILLAGFAIAILLWVATERNQADIAIAESKIGQQLATIDIEAIDGKTLKVLDIQYRLTSTKRNSCPNCHFLQTVQDILSRCDRSFGAVTHALALEVDHENGATQSMESAIDRHFISCQLSRNFDPYVLGSVWLNRSYFGGSVYGLDDAVKVAFGESVDVLTDRQAAMMIDRLHHPNSTKNDEELLKRAEHVLTRIKNDEARIIVENEKSNDR